MNSNYEPSPFEYFKTCITDKYLDFDGRARRAEYWYFQLFTALAYLPFAVLFIVAAILESEVLVYTLIGFFMILMLALFLPSIAVTVRRLHDTDKSGWFYLLGLIPGGSIAKAKRNPPRKRAGFLFGAQIPNCKTIYVRE